MKFKCCQGAISEFYIGDTYLSFCKSFTEKYKFLENYNEGDDFVEEYLLKRKEYIDNCKNNKNIPQICQKCNYFIEYDYDESSEKNINWITLLTTNKCSCDCIYCYQTNGKTEQRKKINRQNFRSVKQTLKALEEKNLIASSGLMIVSNGECCEFPKEETEFLLDFCKRNNYIAFIPTSGIFYSKEIEQALKNDIVDLVISVDSGTKETFEKIKRINYFDNVWENIKKYIIASKDNPKAHVFLKYIIIDKINDNIEEFNEFLKRCNETGCRHIKLTFTYEILIEGKKPSASMINLLNYAKSLNDERIQLNYFLEMKGIKTSAKQYSKETEEKLIHGQTHLTIVVFAGKKETYKKLTGTENFDIIWSNIEKYSKLINKDIDVNCFSQITILYKLIPQVNNSVEELTDFINLCDKYNLRNIEIDLYNNKNLDNVCLDNIKSSLEFFKKFRNFNIKFSDGINKLLN